MHPTRQLRRLARIKNGSDHSRVQDDNGAYPVYGSGGEFARACQPLHSGPSVLLGRKGTIDRPILVNGEFWTVDTMFCVQPYPNVSARFLYYACTTIPFSQLSTNTALPSMTQGDLKEVRLPAPDFGTQNLIADFLDRETAKIDALISKQEQLIATLREESDRLWAQDVVQLSESFPTVQLRRVIESIADGPFGSSLTSSHYSPEGARVVRLGNIGINEFRDNDHAYIPLDYARTLATHEVTEGDVVVAGLGDEKMPLGRAAVVPDIGPAIVKADCYRIRTRADRLRPDYLAWFLSAPPTRSQIALLARGATRSRLNTSVVKNVKIPTPPLTTQESVVLKSRDHLSRITILVSEAEKLSETLHEYRSALITNAVTGKIDVRETA
ncbi:type I restriction enzyme specificity protein [Gordonia paraffinivorans NBRC 108238]|uniref:Type I restriction enzyme specificity protein n=1 Tax=Gordonia paraffinivorans NBRC 108238 TaxID=1223543 RepID=A0ABQ0ILL7_9ACTN|nr:restriction endonuclease subunit S [Gordonia paraffinivorans]GAC84452.1 type I restriction enzyme specificity protein [Gordonia paraffinivorans NBRC 108238]